MSNNSIPFNFRNINSFSTRAGRRKSDTAAPATSIGDMNLTYASLASIAFSNSSIILRMKKNGRIQCGPRSPHAKNTLLRLDLSRHVSFLGSRSLFFAPHAARVRTNCRRLKTRLCRFWQTLNFI